MNDKEYVENNLEQLKSFRDKADLLASIHSKLSDQYKSWHTAISSILLLISSILVGMTFISDQFIKDSIGLMPNTWKWIVGIISILNFAGILLLSEWKFQESAASHREAVRFYFAIVNRIRELVDRADKTEITDETVEKVRADYGRTQALPKIPDSRFLKLKQWHLQKVAISREISKSPFQSMKNIKKRMIDKEQE